MLLFPRQLGAVPWLMHSLSSWHASYMICVPYSVPSVRSLSVYSRGSHVRECAYCDHIIWSVPWYHYIWLSCAVSMCILYGVRTVPSTQHAFAQCLSPNAESTRCKAPGDDGLCQLNYLMLIILLYYTCADSVHPCSLNLLCWLIAINQATRYTSSFHLRMNDVSFPMMLLTHGWPQSCSPLLYIYSDPHPVLGSKVGHGQEVDPPVIAAGSLPHISVRRQYLPGTKRRVMIILLYCMCADSVHPCSLNLLCWLIAINQATRYTSSFHLRMNDVSLPMMTHGWPQSFSPLLYMYSDPHSVLGSKVGHGQEVDPPVIAAGPLPYISVRLQHLPGTKRRDMMDFVNSIMWCCLYCCSACVLTLFTPAA